MPELPEVECITRALQQYCPGKTITKIEIFFPKLLRNCTPKDFISRVVGQAIQKVKRKGKYILIYLSSKELLEIHLRMTGNFLYYRAPVSFNKYIRAVFYLNGNQLLLFQDIRKFATFALWPEEQLHQAPSFNLGCDLLDEKFDLKFFQALINKRPARTIKALLLDQKMMAGMGNIYSDEALFRAGIHPLRKTGSLRLPEQARLFQELNSILQEAISLQGTSFSNYRNLAGEEGGFQEMLRVYQRKGKPCFRCGTKIERHLIAGRGTYLCSSCQPLLPAGGPKMI